MNEKRIPERLCVGCRQMKPKTELLRIIRMPDGSFHVDAGLKAGGRGAYICRNAECIRCAIEKRGLERSFRTGIPKDQRELLLKEMKLFVE